MQKEAVIILVALATPFFLSLIWLMRTFLHGFSEMFTGIVIFSWIAGVVVGMIAEAELNRKRKAPQLRLGQKGGR